MNIKQTEVILEALRITYPRFFPNTQEDMQKAVGIWSTLCENIPYEDMNMAVKTYICSNDSGYPPTIGQLNKIITDTKLSNLPDPDEAWDLVRKAIANGLYGAEEEFNALPEICQKIVAGPSQLRDWAYLDSKGLNLVRNSFLNRYRDVRENIRSYLSLSPKVAETRDKIAGSVSMQNLLGCK